MNLIIVGLNHRTAPVDIREKLSFPVDSIGEALKKLVTNYGINEAVILSTCNRVEVAGIAPAIEKGIWEIKRFLSEYHNIPLENLDEHLYVHTGEDAVRHIFRVSAGLDSMCLGEPQILGQVKDAYSYAVHNNTAGAVVNKLFPQGVFRGQEGKDGDPDRRLGRFDKLRRGGVSQKDIRGFGG